MWQAEGVQAVGDLGGSILTGIDGNPLAVLCKQLRIPHHHINSQDVKLYMSNGKESDPELDTQVRESQSLAPLLDRVPGARSFVLEL